MLIALNLFSAFTLKYQTWYFIDNLYQNAGFILLNKFGANQVV